MKFHRIVRETGLVEIACEHGVGHPSRPLTDAARGPQFWQPWMAIHGCDGCCGTTEWRVAAGELPVSALDHCAGPKEEE